MEARARKRGVVCLSAALAALVVAWPAQAKDPEVVIVGEVGAAITRPNVDLPKVLRHAIERELSALAFDQRARRERYVLSASLVKLEGRATKVECTVSVVLRERKSGAIRVITEGKARVDGAGETSSSELEVIEAAAHGALAS